MKIFFFLLGISAFELHAATYRHAAPVFRFDYDQGAWEEAQASEKASQSSSQKTLVTLQSKTAQEGYHPRFSVVMDEISKAARAGETPLRAYYLHALDFLRSQNFSNLKTKNGPGLLPKVKEEVYEIIGNQRNFGLTFRQVIAIDGETALLITGACRTAEYQKNGCGLEPLFASFELPQAKGK